MNDKTLGSNLEIIDIFFNEDAALNSFGLHYQGKDRFVVREEIAKKIRNFWSFGGTKPTYLNKVGTSERTKAVIEPRLSDQWFSSMEIEVGSHKISLESDEIKLYPSRFNMQYKHW
jgi:valyl-tRNA synthetase